MAGRLDRAEYEGSHALARTCGRRQYADLVKNLDGYCPDHSTGVSCPVGMGVNAS